MIIDLSKVMMSRKLYEIPHQCLDIQSFEKQITWLDS